MEIIIMVVGLSERPFSIAKRTGRSKARTDHGPVRKPKEMPASNLEPNSTWSYCDINNPEPTLSEKEKDVLDSKIKADFKWTHMTLATGLILAYLLGFGGFSLAWILVVTVFVCSTCRNCVKTSLKQLLAVEQIKLNRKRALKETTETAEWLNFLINKWWVFSSQSIFLLVKEKLDPVILSAKPAFLEKVEIKQFTLGDETPTVRTVRSYQVARGSNVTQVIENQIVLELDFNMACNDFSMVFRARLGGKGVGVDLDIAVESLHVQGKLHAVVTLSLDVPFPHLSRLSFYFVEKPEVWFNVCILKAVQMMEVPVVKSWIHSLVTDALETALVDPGKLDVDLTTPDSVIAERFSDSKLAQGVLIMSLSCVGLKNSGFFSDEDRWLAIRVGKQKQTAKPNNNIWDDCKIFLVESLEADRIEFKLKSKRLISIITHGEYETSLANFKWEAEKINEFYLQKRGSKLVPSLTEVNGLSIRMQYCPLPPIQFDCDDIPMAPILDQSGPAGIVYVCIHRAESLVTSCWSQEVNPYCIFFLNRKKMITTHFIRRNSSPVWNCTSEFVVTDYSKIQFTFAVCNWTGGKDDENSMLGVANLHIKNEEQIINTKLSLSYTLQTPTSIPRQQSYLYVSVIFRAVPSITTWDEGCGVSRSVNVDLDDHGSCHLSKPYRENSHSFMRQAKMILSNRDSELTNLGDILSQGTGLMEFVICRARDLVAKDLNGFSDPYCEVKVRSECRFKTTVRKNTLNPVWNECLTTSLPHEDETLDIIIWDQDPFGLKDFLGSLSLSVAELRSLSDKDSPQWFPLRNAKTGAIEIRVKIFAEYFPNGVEEHDKKDCVFTRSYIPREDIGVSCNPPEIQVRSDSLSNKTSLKPLQLLIPTSSSSVYPVDLDTPPPLPPPLFPEYCSKLESELLSSSIMDTHLKSEMSPLSRISSTGSICHRGSSDDYSSPRCFKSSPTDSQHKENGDRHIKGRIRRKIIGPLRRFRSEVIMSEKTSRTIAVEYCQNGMDSDDGLDAFNRAQSQPDISRSAMKPLMKQPDVFYCIQGKIKQIQGLRPIRAGVQIYIHVKLLTYACYPQNQTNGPATQKTIAKSKLLAASPNPHFNMSFDINPSSGITRDCALSFEIKTSSKEKEIVGARIISLQDIFSGCLGHGEVIHHWLRMDNDATMEVEIKHNKPRKSFPGKNLFKSLSVYRIGKV